MSQIVVILRAPPLIRVKTKNYLHVYKFFLATAHVLSNTMPQTFLLNFHYLHLKIIYTSFVSLIWQSLPPISLLHVGETGFENFTHLLLRHVRVTELAGREKIYLVLVLQDESAQVLMAETNLMQTHKCIQCVLCCRFCMFVHVSNTFFIYFLHIYPGCLHAFQMF